MEKSGLASASDGFGRSRGPLRSIVATAALLVALAACASQSQVEEVGGCALCQPVAEGDMPQVALLLQRGAKLTARDQAKGEMPLYSAVDKGHLDIALLLLKHGADPNVAGHSGVTPLEMAASGYGDPVLTEALIEAGAKANARNSHGNTLLLVTTLMFSKIQDGLGVVQVLLAAGADPNLKSQDDWTPLGALAFNFPLSQHPDGSSAETTRRDILTAAKLLLASGADPNAPRVVDEAIEAAHLDDATRSKLVPDASLLSLLRAYGAHVP